MFAHMRIARPVTDLELTCRMYCDALELNKIADFIDHDGFSGVMVGHRSAPWHIEFTLCHHHPVKPAATAEDLLVLYYPDAAEWTARCEAMRKAGFTEVVSFNPYWDISGKSWQDNDGYRVVLQNRAWVTD
ncbi:VOC family protein [Kosakonia sacchari]|uniref:VOC family protein n=1 Tax=Kosakonia sacchari TaxID=1158459 RepID=A0ABZ0MVN5_9ENTR|nr:VOC family protein [Kosakonia sacchari]WOZ79127.1 VOC family protein [Kosakonia sacchari]